ncbi:hypothetical protein LCGC14_0540590 [marine sediment metagenome]|uniref:Uncharacterized protein n=1 Tax=marine sediment metagenome TaxID=412755 RepID=A0A0F9UEC9_9ZZZZ
MKTIIKIRTWRCSKCDYAQDFEPTQENMNVHFNNDRTFKVSNLKENECPSCALKGGAGLLKKVTNNAKKIKMTVMGEENIEDEIVEKDKEAEKEGKSKMTSTQKNTYRTKRKKDIEEAIVKARLLEDN